jgi:hypothetical protein
VSSRDRSTSSRWASNRASGLPRASAARGRGRLPTGAGWRPADRPAAAGSGRPAGPQRRRRPAASRRRGPGRPPA